MLEVTARNQRVHSLLFNPSDGSSKCWLKLKRKTKFYHGKCTRFAVSGPPYRFKGIQMRCILLGQFLFIIIICSDFIDLVIFLSYSGVSCTLVLWGLILLDKVMWWCVCCATNNIQRKRHLKTSKKQTQNVVCLFLCRCLVYSGTPHTFFAIFLSLHCFPFNVYRRFEQIIGQIHSFRTTGSFAA